MSFENEDKIYNLQQLKKKLLELKIKSIEENKESLENIYGLFGSDNSFIFAAQQSSILPRYNLSIFAVIEYYFNMLFCDARLFSRFYYMKDVFSKTIISEYFDEQFTDGETYEFNDINYYVISPSKIIPASYLAENNNLNLALIQDCINEFLSNNPDFINQVFFQEINENDINSEPPLERALKNT